MSALNSETHTEKLVRAAADDLNNTDRQMERLRSNGLHVAKDADPLTALVAIRAHLVKTLDVLPQGGWGDVANNSLATAIACIDRLLDKLNGDEMKKKVGS